MDVSGHVCLAEDFICALYAMLATTQSQLSCAQQGSRHRERLHGQHIESWGCFGSVLATCPNKLENAFRSVVGDETLERIGLADA